MYFSSSYLVPKTRRDVKEPQVIEVERVGRVRHIIGNAICYSCLGARARTHTCCMINISMHMIRIDTFFNVQSRYSLLSTCRSVREVGGVASMHPHAIPGLIQHRGMPRPGYRPHRLTPLLKPISPRLAWLREALGLGLDLTPCAIADGIQRYKLILKSG